MLKYILTIATIIFFSSTSFAQKQEEANKSKVGKYEVQAVMNSDGSYGYLIYKEGSIVAEQNFKPFLTKPEGFINKENALKLAKWHATQLDTKKSKTIKIDIKAARQLGISREDLETRKSNQK